MTKHHQDEMTPFIKDLTDLTQFPEENLQDLIFDEFDKLQALTSAQAVIDNTQDMSCSFVKKHRGHYSTLLDDQVHKVRTLLDRYFR